MNKAQAPQKIKLHKKSCLLELLFEETIYKLNAEYLRVYSPSAEVKGHGPGDETLQVNKENVSIINIEAQGNYAIKLIYSDGHDSGIYTWEYLRELCENREKNWQNYLERVEQHKLKKPADHAPPQAVTLKWVKPDSE